MVPLPYTLCQTRINQSPVLEKKQLVSALSSGNQCQAWDSKSEVCALYKTTAKVA